MKFNFNFIKNYRFFTLLILNNKKLLSLDILCKYRLEELNLHGKILKMNILRVKLTYTLFYLVKNKKINYNLP